MNKNLYILCRITEASDVCMNGQMFEIICQRSGEKVKREQVRSIVTIYLTLNTLQFDYSTGNSEDQVRL